MTGNKKEPTKVVRFCMKHTGARFGVKLPASKVDDLVMSFLNEEVKSKAYYLSVSETRKILMVLEDIEYITIDSDEYA